MRKKIALFANGWGSDCLQEIGLGLSRYSEEKNVDIFAFVNYSAYSETKSENNGEFNIFMLPDLGNFDGAVLLANSFNLQKEIDYLQGRVLESKIPTISLEYELDGMGYLGSDNYSGMYELTTHLIEQHNVKRMLFIGGFKEHLDCQTRLKAVVDATAAHGIQISEEDILFGDWSANSAEVCLEVWLDKGKPMPEAIVCANDLMAIGISDWLRERGYDVPGRVIVTGYDCIGEALNHIPSITTVKRDWESMGYQAVEMLLNRTTDELKNMHMQAKARLVCGTSCGCCVREEESEGNFGYAKNANLKVDWVESDRHFRHLYMSVRKDETAEDVNRSLSMFFKQECWMEGDNCALFLNPKFFGLDEQDDDMRVPGYSEEVDMICSLNNGEPEMYRSLTKKEAIFRASERSVLPGVYIFLPIHGEDRNYGFAMLSRDFEIVGKNLLYIWTRHFGQNMEQVRSNVKIAELTRKLSVLSVTDVLTNTYNRAGCEKVIYPFLRECQARGGRGIIMIADIDRMKNINDQYGHGQGDLALKIASKVLKEELPEGFLVARFGGDEFLIAGECKEDITLETIIKKLTDRLAKKVEEQEVIFSLTLSLGGVVLKRGEEFDLNDSLQKADEYMYAMKEIHHERLSATE